MGWDYDWRAGPKGASLTALDLYANMIRQVGDIDSGLRGQDPIIQYAHGSRYVRKWSAAKELMLEVAVRDTNSSGTVTHTDGRAGHVYENLAAIRGLLAGNQGSQATLQQTAPDWGTVQLDVQQLSPSMPTQNRFVFGFLLYAADPFWRSTTQGSSTGNPAVGGNAPAYPIIEFTVAGTNAKVVHDDSGASIQIDGTLPAGGVEVDCLSQTCTKISDGSDYSANLTLNRAWWMILDPDKTNTLTRSGGGTQTVKWNDRWR